MLKYKVKFGRLKKRFGYFQPGPGKHKPLMLTKILLPSQTEQISETYLKVFEVTI
jgi:hypothetical protein